MPIPTVDKAQIEASEMHILGHKIFVRLQEIPMYLSKKTRDSIRNRYSHSIEVGLSTEYLLAQLSRHLGKGIDLNFFAVAKTVGMVHDIGHTAFSHDGEVILDRLLQEASKTLPETVRFNANLNNFRRIEKYGLFDLMPEAVKRYALASLIKRRHELSEYPEYHHLVDDLDDAISLETSYLHANGIIIENTTGKTLLCQAMDLADENRYRVTDIIDALNIYSKDKLREMLTRTLRSPATLGTVRTLVPLPDTFDTYADTLEIRKLLTALLEQESNAKTAFQNMMNILSMAFNRNVRLSKDGSLTPHDDSLEALREEFHQIAATYLWGSKRVNKIKKPFKHYFSTVAEYFIDGHYELDCIDSHTYRKALSKLRQDNKNPASRRLEELRLLRNFLGGLTNPRIYELYKRIQIDTLPSGIALSKKKRKNLIEKTSMGEFEKKITKYRG